MKKTPEAGKFQQLFKTFFFFKQNLLFYGYNGTFFYFLCDEMELILNLSFFKKNPKLWGEEQSERN